ncbi:MAG: hypothetical protein ACSHXB_19350 [Sulfitobacter sp.]
MLILFNRHFLYPLKLMFLLLFLIALSGAAISQENINPLIHPGNRYARENTSIDRLAYWSGTVGVQIIGEEDKTNQLMILADIAYLGEAANAKIDVYGFPNTIFSVSTLADSSKIVLLTYDSRQEPMLRSGLILDERLGEIDVSNSHPAIAYILGSGLVEQADGCLAKWKASDQNEIQGIVIAASDSLTSAARRVCFRNLIPTAFGVPPTVSRFDARSASNKLQPAETIIFEDRSELVLELSAAATCRSKLGDFGAMCPFRLINQIFDHHSYLKSLEAS